MSQQSRDRKYWWLLTSLIGIYLIAPIFDSPQGMKVVAELALILVLTSAIWGINHYRKEVLLAIFITNV